MGLCSRREADKWIEQGRIMINGKVAKKGNRVTDADEVIVDGGFAPKKKIKPIYIALHKPVGVTCTTDQRDPTNIIDFMRHSKRIFPIGRLDKASTGLIFLTNDGDIVNRILRVENKKEKEYIVSVDRPINEEFVRRMGNGIPILGKKTKKCFVKQLGKNTFKIILTQGLNRQIRRMCEFLGYKVRTLKRVRIMDIELGGLKPGKWRNLTESEVKGLKGERR